MRPRWAVLAATSAIVLAGFAHAQVAPPPPQAFVLLRQASLDMSALTKGGMEAAMKADKEARTQAYAAASLAKWAHALPSMFPSGSGPGETPYKTQARAAIWQSRPAFEAAAANYGAAADRLAELAGANDTEGFKAQLVTLSHACDACHAAFKDGDRGPR